jgi:hypothetical protein
MLIDSVSFAWAAAAEGMRRVDGGARPRAPERRDTDRIYALAAAGQAGFAQSAKMRVRLTREWVRREVASRNDANGMECCARHMRLHATPLRYAEHINSLAC